MKTRPMLEIRLHMLNGHTHTYTQSDPELVQAMLRQLHRKVFQLQSLVITGEDEVCVFRGAAIAGISILCDTLPAELAMLDNGVADVWTISEDEYHERQSLLRGARPDQISEVLGEISFATGQKTWIVQRLSRSEGGDHDPRQMLRHAFDMPNLVCRRRDGGLSIWNRDHIVSFAFTPRVDAPAYGWSAEHARESLLSSDDRTAIAQQVRSRVVTPALRFRDAPSRPAPAVSPRPVSVAGIS